LVHQEKTGYVCNFSSLGDDLGKHPTLFLTQDGLQQILLNSIQLTLFDAPVLTGVNTNSFVGLRNGSEVILYGHNLGDATTIRIKDDVLLHLEVPVQSSTNESLTFYFPQEAETIGLDDRQLNFTVLSSYNVTSNNI
jgi:hypothetical protein